MSRSHPQYEPFSRHTLKREIQKLYESEKEKVKEMFKNTNEHIYLTTDNWRSEHNREEFICITAHFVDNNWKLHKRIIFFKDLTPPFDGRNIADEVFMNLLQWNIQNKVLTITADNASYNDVMINNVKNRLVTKKSLIRNGDFFQVRCCAHIVNLIVQTGLGALKEP
ncbi:hypothetical protein M5689_006518 [Euphorbia peplus]|nr:hypothetical protein M5689_006518 [Euphorbia peplus]